ncbi:head GIN domain-containing protein [Tenacibaculum sp. SG-28]|uniref:head GIN domain-containing protein n=1 Tax=Tenacibaculum sp. SG-28 TaxID=754426 RepID=UPI000CF391AF|nr:head GIN domain-containing protein [Tenacibaculum sp. SG-28]PQJ22003.1 DUF2807 domain-containing protein [Tenacibaculum sp. SG-28]
MKRVLILLLIFTIGSATAQSSITQKLGPFKELKVYNGIDVALVKSNKVEAVISGEKASKVKFKADNNRLKIMLNFPETTADGKAKITLYYNQDIAIIDGNEGAIITSSMIEQEKIEIKGQEGAFINIVVAVKHLKVKSTSGSVIKLSGTAKNQYVDVDLGANYHGYNLSVSAMNVVRAGSGAKAEVDAGETLDAKVSFGGTIFYKGNPDVLVDKKVIGGVIKQRS